MSVPMATGSSPCGPVQDTKEQVNMVLVMAADLPVPVAALVLVVLALLTSTLDSLLASNADLPAEDVYFRLLRPQASDLQLKQAARRWWGLGGCHPGAVLASAGLASVPFFTGALVALRSAGGLRLYWRTANRTAAIAAMLAGSVVGLPLC